MTEKHPLPLKSILLVLGALAALLSVLLLLSYNSEQKQMRQNMQERADSLIFAVEGGARFLMFSSGRRNPVQQLFIEEISRQPDIAYLAVVNTQGIAVAHTDAEANGQRLINPEQLITLKTREDVLATFSTGADIYSITKKFTPLFVARPDNGHNMHGRRSHNRTQPNMPPDFVPGSAPELFLSVGIEPERFRTALHSSMLRQVLLAVFVMFSATCLLFIYLLAQRSKASHRELQQQRELNERLRVLGSMAAGVAHEVRNPLSSIKGFAAILAERFPKGDSNHATAVLLMEEVERINRVVSGLLSVAGAGELHPTPTALTPVLEKALKVAGADAANAGVKLNFTDSLILLKANIDADKILQAMLNLLINAVQATPKGGTVSLKASPQTKSGQEYASITITDTGHGISQKGMAKLFEPYFTTKSNGTGLGLTITRQIIEQHGGKITVQSTEGSGCTFTVLLPRLIEQK